MAEGERIGTVTHYYGEISVAIVRVEDGELSVGDTVRVVGGEDQFTCTVDSMEVEHEKVERAQAGQEVGIKVPQKAWPNADVFLVPEGAGEGEAVGDEGDGDDGGEEE